MWNWVFRVRGGVKLGVFCVKLGVFGGERCENGVFCVKIGFRCKIVWKFENHVIAGCFLWNWVLKA